MHHLSCILIQKIFSDWKVVEKLDFTPKTVIALKLAEYYDMEEVTSAHKQLILVIVKLFVNRLAHVQSSEIFSNTAILVKIMRQEYVVA